MSYESEMKERDLFLVRMLHKVKKVLPNCTSTMRATRTAPCVFCGQQVAMVSVSHVTNRAESCYSCMIIQCYIPKEGGGYRQKKKLSTTSVK